MANVNSYEVYELTDLDLSRIRNALLRVAQDYRELAEISRIPANREGWLIDAKATEELRERLLGTSSVIASYGEE